MWKWDDERQKKTPTMLVQAGRPCRHGCDRRSFCGSGCLNRMIWKPDVAHRDRPVMENEWRITHR